MWERESALAMTGMIFVSVDKWRIMVMSTGFKPMTRSVYEPCQFRRRGYGGERRRLLGRRRGRRSRIGIANQIDVLPKR